jgi:hypothetical protein
MRENIGAVPQMGAKIGKGSEKPLGHFFSPKSRRIWRERMGQLVMHILTCHFFTDEIKIPFLSLIHIISSLTMKQEK